MKHVPADILQDLRPLRVWSLVVTVFGDVVMREGTDLSPPPLWTGHLMALLADLGVEPGPARTALSRLVTSGLLVRRKVGRNTFHSLEKSAASEFAAAADRIYGRAPRRPLDHLWLAAIDRCEDRSAARAALEARDFRFIGAATAIGPAHANAPVLELQPGALVASLSATKTLAPIVGSSWRLEELRAAYRSGMRDISACRGAVFAPRVALAARVALVHVMRRIILRDPDLPAAVLPVGWEGPAARAAFVSALNELREPSELYIRQSNFREGLQGCGR